MEEAVYVKIDSHTVPLFFDSFRRRGRSGATAVFADIDTAGRAAEFVGLEFSLNPRGSSTGKGAGRGASAGSGGRGEADGTAPSEDNELYFEDLVGWEAELRSDDGDGESEDDGVDWRGDDGDGDWRKEETVRGAQKGRITAFFDSELNPLLEIEIGSESETNSEAKSETEAATKSGTTAKTAVRHVLIPAVDEFIDEIDENARKIVFSLPGGLLSLN
jgi:hypothetical protein